jgi:prepilin-type N-terminal cleavage/methylation domain-containing protein
MRDERGMTLVEIVVAVAVITIGLIAIATGMQLATAGVAQGQQQTTAAFLAEQHLEDIKAFALSTAAAQGWTNVTSANFPAAEAYGTIAGFTTYRRETDITTPTATTKRVTVRVYWRGVGVGNSNAERNVTVSTVLASRS